MAWRDIAERERADRLPDQEDRAEHGDDHAAPCLRRADPSPAPRAPDREGRGRPRTSARRSKSTGTTGVRLVRLTTKPSRASSAVAPVCTNIDGTITARRPCVSISRPPRTRTPIAETANARVEERQRLHAEAVGEGRQEDEDRHRRRVQKNSVTAMWRCRSSSRPPRSQSDSARGSGPPGRPLGRLQTYPAAA